MSPTTMALRSELAAARSRASAAKREHKEDAMDVLIGLLEGGAAMGLGALERHGHVPIVIPKTKVPTKLALAGAAAGLALATKGKTRRTSLRAAQMFYDLFMYNGGRSGSLVAGE